MVKKKAIAAMIVLSFAVAGLIYFVFLKILQQEKETSAEEKKDFLTIKVYFNNSDLAPEFSCSKVLPVERKIIKTPAVGRAALQELLKGPTDAEKKAGFFTSINPEVKIQRLLIKRGIARVDFDEKLEHQVGGSCRVDAIQAQISETLKQFPIVQDIIISINGRSEGILQP